MSFVVQIDRVGNAYAPEADTAVIAPGQTLYIAGWIADPEGGRVAQRLAGLVDGSILVDAKNVSRPDVAICFGKPELAPCGFNFTIPSKAFAIGAHEFTFSFFDDIGKEYQATPIPFNVLPYADGLSSRILVAAAPKSGSTYTSVVLQHYFKIIEPNILGTYWNWEHNLDAGILAQLHGRSYVLQKHMRPYGPNLAAVRLERMSVIVTWRNLADMVISLDDHIRKEGMGAHFLVHMVDDAAYVEMPDQRRYRFLIRFVVPWYVNFYLGWKEQDVSIFHYELLAKNPHAYFAEIIGAIAGTVDEARLSAVLDSNAKSAVTRGNVGKNGRSLEAFAPDTREVLEELLLSHVVPLDDLINELPWHSKL